MYYFLFFIYIMKINNNIHKNYFKQKSCKYKLNLNSTAHRLNKSKKYSTNTKTKKT